MTCCDQEAKAQELRRAEEVSILQAEKANLGQVLSAGARRCAELESHVQQLERRVDEAQVEVGLLQAQMREKDMEISLMSSTLIAANEKGARLEQSVTETQIQVIHLQKEFDEKRKQILSRAAKMLSELKGPSSFQHICTCDDDTTAYMCVCARARGRIPFKLSKTFCLPQVSCTQGVSI